MPDESRPSIRRVSFVTGALFALAGATVTPTIVLSQAARVTRAEIIRAEDARGKGPSGIQPLVDGLEVSNLRQLSIRAIGRLEQPYLVAHIIPFLDEPGLSATTADAIAQSLQGLNAESMQKPERALVDSLSELLRTKAVAEKDWTSKGVFARSIGRLPYDGKQAREAESALIALAPVGDRPEMMPTLEGIAHGLYALARSRRETGDLSPTAIEWLRKAATYRPGVKGDVQVRRPAWLALNAAGGADRPTIETSSKDADEQVRRLVVAALPNVEDPAFQREQLDRAARDPQPMVRLEWVRVYRQLAAATDCRPLLAAMADTVHHVTLAAIDALGSGPCPAGDSVAAALRRTIDRGPAAVTRRTARGWSWHARAHALNAIARVDPKTAQDLLRRDARHPVWQVRMYVARGAAAIKDSVLLTSLALDDVGNVREVAIQGLSATLGHLPDLAFVHALSSKHYQVVLAAARALRGTRAARDSVVSGVMDALERISREQRQTSRDPRIELLARVRELADSQVVPRLQPLLGDVDEVVAAEAASVMNLLTKSTRFTAAPKGVAPLASLAAPPAGSVRVRVTMSPATGGGSFDVLLDGDGAPMTVARVSQLIRNKYYDGLTWHRVVPNFVLQGGSPGMNEYVGDGPFMRDELGLAHHDRYTLGISTRGRDTGDGQWFINLVDNYRLDHDYTVFAKVVSGFDVVDRIIEGDVMQSVRIVPGK